MEVTKIKIKQSQVAIDYNKMVIVDEHESINKYSIVSPEHPTMPFKLAFQKMDFFLIEMCELCGSLDEIPIMCDDVKITGLSFKYEEGELSGAVITGTKALAYSNSPLVLNTPHKSVNFGGEWNKMIHLTGPCVNALQLVIEQAKNYVGGERLQIEIKLNDQSETKPKSTEPVQFDEREEKSHITDPIGEGNEVPIEEQSELPQFKDDSAKLGPHALGDKNVSRETSEDTEIPKVPD